MARLTLILIGINVIVFVFQSLVGTPLIFTFIPAFAFRMPWMFITSTFLHGGGSHLFFNMIILFFMGISLERMFGEKRFLFIYLLAGIIGNLGYMLTAPDAYTPSLGASGSIYGVMGSLVALRPLMLVFVGMLPLPLILVVIGYAVLDFAGLFEQTGIAHGAHIGGLVIGVIYGLYFRQTIRIRKTAKMRSSSRSNIR